MEKHDPQAFEQLFQTEPRQPSPDDVTQWVDIYGRLVDVLTQQLEQTRQFADSVPEAMRHYLSRENIKILDEELAIFRERLSHWTALR